MVIDDFVCSEIKGVLEVLGNVVRGMFVEFENNVRNEMLKKLMINGEVYFMICYVMNYMKLIVDYAVILNSFLENDELDGLFRDDDIEEMFFFVKRMFRLIICLELNLEEKLKLYEDGGL